MDFKTHKKTFIKIAVAILAILVIYWLIPGVNKLEELRNIVKGIVSPFLLGATLAFAINVPMAAIEKRLTKITSRRWRRALAMICTIFAISIVIGLVLLFLIPQLIRTVQSLFESLPTFIDSINTNIMLLGEKYPNIKEAMGITGDGTIQLGPMVEKVLSYMGQEVNSIVNGTVNLVGSAFSAIFNAFVAIIFAFYCLAEKETLAKQSRRLLYSITDEKRADEALRILRMTYKRFTKFITTQCLEALILGGLFIPAMAIFRLPYILLISIIIAVTALVPMVGAFVGCFIGAFLILVNDPMQAITFVILFIALQQFENNVIYPRVVGKSIGLPGMWVLVAVAVGGGIMGAIGMVVMVPIVSVIYTLLHEYTDKKLAEKQVDPKKLAEEPEVTIDCKPKPVPKPKKRHKKRAKHREKEDTNE